MIQQYNLNHQNQAAEVDAFQAILKHWKRKFLPSDIENNPNCWVCLDNFKFDEDVVELHWNPGSFGHIFHPDCINDWSQKQRTWPLCRKDFIDLVKQEKNNGLIHEEIKADPINLHREGNYLHPGQDVLLEIGQLNRVLINQNRIYRVDETAADEEEDSQNEGNAPYLNELPFAGGRNHRYLNQQRAPNLPESRVGKINFFNI